MVQEFRYSLTRICLRTGQLSLSQRMAESFPDETHIRALDTVDGRELELEALTPRRIGGVAEFFRRHRLQVNDVVQMKVLPDGRVSLTALPRKPRNDYQSADVVARLLDELSLSGPRTVEEIRALHPDIPADFPLEARLRADRRLELRAGRWAARKSAGHIATGTDSGKAEAERLESAPEGAHSEASEAATEHLREVTPEAVWEGVPETAPESLREAAPETAPEGDSSEADTGAAPEFPGQSVVDAVREGAGVTMSEAPLQGTRHAARETRRQGRRADARGRRTVDHQNASVTPYPRGVMFPGEAGMNSKRAQTGLELVDRARETLSRLGYRVVGLPQSFLLARAELGRREHTVLVRVMADGERLDWASLLATRRQHTPNYMAVFGDHRDLHRLVAPAELARATLWSWEGLARVDNLAGLIAIGPFDLEPHFMKGGMFESGLEEFERSVGGLIAERGVVSTVIARLAVLRAPCVFLIDDIDDGAEISRERIAAVLEQLELAPFHLVTRVDSGEYCLRHRVDEALRQLSEYALSLRARIPAGQEEGRREGVRLAVKSSERPTVEPALEDVGA